MAKMNIQMIRSCMHNFEEVIFLGKEVDAAGTLVLAAAAAREEKCVQIYLFGVGEDARVFQERLVLWKKPNGNSLRKRWICLRREAWLWKTAGQ